MKLRSLKFLVSMIWPVVGGAAIVAGARASRPQAPLVDLGRALFHDTSLSSPSGQGCITCHDPAWGYSYPNSTINRLFGVVPGAIPSRFGNRRPPSMAYAALLPPGPPRWDPSLKAYVGGLFLDGRADSATEQAKQPFFNPKEMNDVVHGMASPETLVRNLKRSPTAQKFREVYGKDSLEGPASVVVDRIAQAIVAYEGSSEVAAFTSKYDAWREGKAQMTGQEMLGMRLVTGSLDGRVTGLPFRKFAHCTDCHALNKEPGQRDLWTDSSYANLGVPRNWMSPRLGKGEDLGLGASLYPRYGLLPGNPVDRDFFQMNGAFKTPTLRNVDKRPFPGAVRAYMHNGYFKSLKDVVHFYNTRNLTTVPGEIIDFTKPHPYARLKGTPLWPRPEVLNPASLVNPTGLGLGPSGGKASMIDPDAGQIGNLLLTDSQEEAIVAFLKTLTDGYFKR